jgi:hypothetical protein
MQDIGKLKIGDIVKFDRGVVIMPSVELSDVRRKTWFRRGDELHNIEAHHKIKVVDAVYIRGKAWYKVVTMVDAALIGGWISSINIIGKRVSFSKEFNYSQDEQSIPKEAILAEVVAIVVILVITIAVCSYVMFMM